MSSRKRISSALIGLIALVVTGWFGGDYLGLDAESKSQSSTSVAGAAESGLPTERLSTLPREAATTWRLIGTNGPFPYPSKDGTVFGNREGVLPEKKSGYYHEYTVPTPGSSSRGARRLVTGQSSEVYYTKDHYDSFVVVDVNG